jgi:aminoglycoside phosphotransferase (APT) family kinase protein
MTDAATPTELTDALTRALRAHAPAWASGACEILPDKGLAHLHIRLTGHGLLARVPKQSQLGLAAEAHLAYEAACFERAAASAHTPRLHAVLAPQPGLPRGALVVDEIVGHPAQLPSDLPAIIDALASIHALPLPVRERRAPLIDPADTLAALSNEIGRQAAHLDRASIAEAARSRIDATLAAWSRHREAPQRPRCTLIAFDGHPGNFIVDAHGRAWLVDLEKARYSHPALDLAHATLYTSTTWDRDSHAVLSFDALRSACLHWCEQVGADTVERRWIAPLRRAMWLWSVTWCAKWRALSSRPPHDAGAGEDWSSALSDDALVAHVRDRVDHYLSPEIVGAVCDETDALERALA